MTRKDRIFAKSVMISSVIPSEKYSWLRSDERLCSGMMAIDRIGGSAALLFHTIHPIRIRMQAPIENTRAGFGTFVDSRGFGADASDAGVNGSTSNGAVGAVVRVCAISTFWTGGVSPTNST